MVQIEKAFVYLGCT